MVGCNLEHFRLVIVLVQKMFLYIPKDLVSLYSVPNFILKKHGFEVPIENNAQNANVEQFCVEQKHINQLT